MMKTPFTLEGKTFLVTGASSGIGLTTCLMINSLGGSFIGVARREAELQKLLSKANPDLNNHVIAADLTKDEDVEKVASSIAVVNGVVHSAGVVNLAPLKFYKRSLMDEMRIINYDAILYLMNGITKKKKLAKNSSVVLVSSIAGLFGMRGNGIYAGTKGALIAITKVWANELALQGTRVNCVAPGMVRTDITQKTINELSAEVVAEDEKKYPLGYGDPEDVAAAITFLLSPASKWITGQTLITDGGRTITI